MHNALMSEENDDRAARLVTARLKDGRFLHATDAAKAMGIDPPTYLGHENGWRGFKHSAKRYARFYKVRLEWLLEGTGSPTMNPLEELWERLPEPAKPELLDYGRFLEAKHGKKP